MISVHIIEDPIALKHYMFNQCEDWEGFKIENRHQGKHIKLQKINIDMYKCLPEPIISSYSDMQKVRECLENTIDPVDLILNEWITAEQEEYLIKNHIISSPFDVAENSLYMGVGFNKVYISYIS